MSGNQIIKVAVTGSICSGKSFVCGWLSTAFNVPLFSSDEAVRQIYQNPAFLYFLKQLPLNIPFISNQYITAPQQASHRPSFFLQKQLYRLSITRGTQKLMAKQLKAQPELVPDKNYIIQNILPHKQKRQILERLVYRYLRIVRKQWVESHKNNATLLFEVPLLFEKKLQNQYTHTICVVAPHKKRLEFATKRGLNPTYFNNANKAQMPPILKSKLANIRVYG